MPWIEDENRREEIILDILQKLPDWFGIPSSTQAYGTDGRSLPLYIQEEAGRPIGFASMKRTSECTGEIYVMGVLKAYHRQGIGRGLVSAVEGRCRAEGLALLQVKTLDPSAENASYLKTYAFYRAMGFMPLETLPLWDAHNPCLILVKPLG